MLIVADHKIPFLDNSFGVFGELRVLPSTKLSQAAVQAADALLVRSETRVDASLLGSSRVRFVGSPTIGVDHIDLRFLKETGRCFANAPGCNARSVVEYVLTALCCLAERRDQPLEGKTLGVVGVGNIGSRLAPAATLLGLRVLLNDPPRERVDGGAEFLPLDDFSEADFITLHVPLVLEGPDTTLHLFGDERIRGLKQSAILINTSRGPVVDNLALSRALEAGRLGGAVLDVWEAEPEPNLRLLRQVDIATPHIAGYSTDGKMKGTWTIFKEFCRFFDLDAEQVKPPQLPAPDPSQVNLSRVASEPVHVSLSQILRQAYPILEDDARLREILHASPSERAKYFRALRANYPLRREFPAFSLGGSNCLGVSEILHSLGFRRAP